MGGDDELVHLFRLPLALETDVKPPGSYTHGRIQDIPNLCPGETKRIPGVGTLGLERPPRLGRYEEAGGWRGSRKKLRKEIEIRVKPRSSNARTKSSQVKIDIPTLLKQAKNEIHMGGQLRSVIEKALEEFSKEIRSN